MSTTYDLTLAADVPTADLSRLAVAVGFEPAALSTGQSGLVSVDLADTEGFTVTVRSGRSGYVEAVDDGGQNWIWEPPAYVAITFWPDRASDYPTDRILPFVAGILTARPEDAALTFNSDILLLTRLSGYQVKYNRGSFWVNHPAGDTVLPG